MKLSQDIQTLIAGISAIQAYSIIRSLGNPGVHVFSKGKLYDVREVVIEDCIRNLEAATVGPFLFWGGPPGKLKYYQGSLYTLLCDRLLDRIQSDGCQSALDAIKKPIPSEYKVKVCL